MTKAQQLGSMTAKGGFLNEADICNKFQNYHDDSEAQIWLNIMGYTYKKINSLTAIQIPVRINKTKALTFGIDDDKDVILSPRGSLKIGRITMQRKGGTPDPTSLQFKMNPLELFNA